MLFFLRLNCAMQYCSSWGIFVLILIRFILVTAVREDNGTYTTRFDNINLDLILGSRRLVRNYVDCLMDVKPCTAEGIELKKLLPDALETKCSKCTMKQKEGAKKVIESLQSRYPEQWLSLKRRWDMDKLKALL